MTVPTLSPPGMDQIRRWQAASRGLAQRAATIQRALAAATTTVFDSRVRLDAAPSGAILQVGLHGTARLSGAQLAQRVTDLYQRALAFIADGTSRGRGPSLQRPPPTVTRTHDPGHATAVTAGASRGRVGTERDLPVMGGIELVRRCAGAPWAAGAGAHHRRRAGHRAGRGGL